MIFPESYALGMSNLGFLRVYELLNMQEDVVAERFFFDKEFFPLRSLESNRHLLEFDVFLFSISFEPSYINLARILSLAGLPLLTNERTNAPLVIAGGIACQINPEPVASFVDAFLLGDFEEIVDGFSRFLMDEYERDIPRRKLIERLASTCKGCYYPEIMSKEGKIRPVIQKTSTSILPHSTIVSNRAYFANTFLMEITRGCGRGCRFCAAGFVYRPPRSWSVEAVENTLSRMNGVDKVGLIGLEYASRKHLGYLCRTLMEHGLSLGFSSLRADAVDEELVALMVGSGTRTATIAPEAGSESLRKRINKNITEEQIMQAASLFAKGGMKNLKLYFMIGLPFEEMSDLNSLVRLVRDIRGQFMEYGRVSGHLGNIIVSVSTFIPKPWTPFQWAGFQDLDILKRKQRFLMSELKKIPNVILRLDSMQEALLQALMSKADRSDGAKVILHILQGRNVKSILRQNVIDKDKYFESSSSRDPFAWEVVSHRVSRHYLLAQWNKAAKAVQSPFCDTEICRRCGACNDTV